MAQLNGNYLNGTNIAVLGTSAHETSEIMVYEHPLFGKVRMFIKNEKAWFCGMDIATSLQYSNTRDAIARHCKSQGVVIHDVIDSMGRTQQMKFISEGNIYRLTAKSRSTETVCVDGLNIRVNNRNGVRHLAFYSIDIGLQCLQACCQRSNLLSY